MQEEVYNLVYHDGNYIPITKMIDMAKKAGEYSLAQPYIISLLYHANKYHLPDINEEIDNIRKHYNLIPFPAFNAPASSNNMPNFETPQKKQSEIAKVIYRKMSKEQREKVLKEALILLRNENYELFKKNACWIGIYLVVKDRLDDDLKMQSFCKFSLTPKDWPSKLTLGLKSLSNIRRYIKDQDQDKAYYLMNNNPFIGLCNKYWEILLGLILTKKSGTS